GESLGLITLGQDQGGQLLDRESREFARVLASHAAGELHKQQLLATLVETKEAEAFKSFSTFLLHDLKNFASTLSLIASNAVRLRENPEFQKDAFQSIFNTAEKMKRLCNSLRTFSTSPEGKKKLDDLNAVVREVVMGLDSTLSTRLRLELGDVPL